MNFKVYDILSSLIPGFLLLLVGLMVSNIPYNNDFIIAYTAIAFLIGVMVNTISSWLEEVYYFTWGGKPSDQLLNGKGIWKVRYFHGKTVKEMLKKDSGNPDANDDELFSIATIHTLNNKDTRIEDFNSAFAFARALLTCCLIGGVFLIAQNYTDWRYYAVIIPITAISWLRAKQRGYYYVREVLNVYYKEKSFNKSSSALSRVPT